MTSFFAIAILSTSGHNTDFFLTLRSNWSRSTHFFSEKERFENLNLCDPGLTRPMSVVGLHGVRLQKVLISLITRAKVTINLVPHARKQIFNSDDLSWPEMDSDPYLVWHLCSQGILTRAWQPRGYFWPPLVFLDISRSYVQIIAKFSTTSKPSISHILRKGKLARFDPSVINDVNDECVMCFQF